MNDGIRKPGNEVLEAAKHSLASLKTNPSQGRMKIASIPSVRSVQQLPSSNDYIAVYKNDE